MSTPYLKAPTILRFIFHPNPQPINICTSAPTREHLFTPSHPLHLAATRRLAAFDPTVLHWSVSATLEVSKKRTVRSWVTRRVREALRAELREKGWGLDGRVLVGEDGAAGKGMVRPLRGALRIIMPPDQRKGVITATGAEVRANVAAIVREVVRKQEVFRPQRDATAGEQQQSRQGQVGPRPKKSRDAAPGKQRATQDRQTSYRSLDLGTG